MAEAGQNVDSMETGHKVPDAPRGRGVFDKASHIGKGGMGVSKAMSSDDSASEGKGESPPKRPDNLCCFSLKECDLVKLEGFDFCYRHILEDKASPFKPCDFVLKTNGKKCPQPAPKLPGGQKSYCLLHTRDSELRKVLETKTKKKKRKLSGQQEEHTRPATSKPGPGRPAGVRNYTKRPKVLEIGAEYRRDDVLRVDSSWHGDYESDSESLDNEMDDPLRHAGVWSAEEVTKMCRDKLLRLRSLYMSQFERLKHVYKNKRRKYLLATSANEEGLTAGNAIRPKPNEPVSALHIASRCYNKRYRTDALLQKQSKEKRLGTASRSQTLPQQRCAHYTDGNRCASKIVPLAKFCLKHICHDPNQQLFLPCSQMISAHQSCGVAVPNVSSREKCIFHVPHTNYLSVGDLEQELQQARERQINKDKEKEEKEKAVHEARLLEIAKSEAAQQVQEPVDDVKTSAILKATTMAQQDLSSSTLDAQEKKVLATANVPLDLSGSPAATATTNPQVKSQPVKQADFACTKPALPLPSTESNQRDGKIGNLTTKSTTSTSSTPSEATSQLYKENAVSVPSKMDVKSPSTVASNVKPSTTPEVGLNCSDNISGDTQGHSSAVPETKSTISDIPNKVS